MSNQKEFPSILKALTDLKKGHGPLAMSILAEMEIMRQVKAHLSQTPDKIDVEALRDLHKKISDEVVSAVHKVVSTGSYKETRTGPVASGNVMLPGQVLNPGNALQNAEFTLTYRQDGALSFDKSNHGNLWKSGTQGSPAGVCLLEEDGNLVIYDPDGNPIWMTGTWGHPGSKLVVQKVGENGYFEIQRPHPNPKSPPIRVWSSHKFLGSVKLLQAPEDFTPGGVSYDGKDQTTLTVPGGQKILCAGARIGDLNPLTASFPKDVRTWVLKVKYERPVDLKSWAITIFDPNDELDVQVLSEKSAVGPEPRVTATVPGDYMLTGGGAEAGGGSYLTGSFPGSPNSWVASSKAPPIGAAGYVTAYAIGIRASNKLHGDIREIFEKKMFETRFFSEAVTSGRGRASGEISLPIGYVLVGGGAAVYSGTQNVLLASYPERNTWKVDAQDMEGLRNTNIPINAYAIGARVGSGTL